jgi:hypothetical protein
MIVYSSGLSGRKEFRTFVLKFYSLQNHDLPGDTVAELAVPSVLRGVFAVNVDFVYDVSKGFFVHDG